MVTDVHSNPSHTESKEALGEPVSITLLPGSNDRTLNGSDDYGLMKDDGVSSNQNPSSTDSETGYGSSELDTVHSSDDSLKSSLLASSLTFSKGSIVPKLYFCATLWHENLNEMTQLVKSICKVDVYNHKQRHAANYVYSSDQVNFFNFEVHIMFDDSMMKISDQKTSYPVIVVEENFKTERKPLLTQTLEYRVNPFVMLLFTAIREATIETYGPSVKLRPPIKTKTPYGGRLTWILPCGTEIQVHLKNLALIRNKKRWSQVMYFFYTLGFRHADLYDKFSDLELSEAVSKYHLDKTFVLALDGDVYFDPESVVTLVNHLKNNPDTAAVCGRLNPVGHGPISWYQRYEYCVFHWFEKTAEVVLGCILCCPGTLTLFRGSAIADHNVGAKYASMANKPREVIQYDLGEDRWLSVMLIEQGHKVAYRSDVDIYTFMPVGFNEFFNQRRRWNASMLSNTAEFILKSGETRKKNKSIYFSYIIYQVLAMLSFLIGPSTFVLMFFWIITANLHLPLWESVIINSIPLIIYVIMGFTVKPKYQLRYAKALTFVYVFIMLIISSRTYSLLTQVKWGSLRDPFTILFVSLTSMSFLTALLHPKELKNMLYWPVYTIYIPTMCLLLLTYTMCNLHLPTWGTREVVKEQLEQSLKKKSKWKRLTKFFRKKKTVQTLNPTQPANQPSHVNNHQDLDDETEEDKEIDKFNSNIEKLMGKCGDAGSEGNNFDDLKSNDLRSHDTRAYDQNVSPSFTKCNQPVETNAITKPQPDAAGVKSAAPDLPTWQLMNWTEDEELIHFPLAKLTPREIEFWEKLIRNHLSPIVYTEARKREIADGLKKLRNYAAAGYLLLNLLMIAGIIVLELNKKFLERLWMSSFVGKYIDFEPLTFAMSIYLVAFIIQFVCMLSERFGIAFKYIIKLIAKSRLTKTSKDPTPTEVIKTKKVQKLTKKLKGDINATTSNII